MCNYMITLALPNLVQRWCWQQIAFSFPSALVNWGEFSLLWCLLNNFLIQFARSDEDDNRGSGR